MPMLMDVHREKDPDGVTNLCVNVVNGNLKMLDLTSFIFGILATFSLLIAGVVLIVRFYAFATPKPKNRRPNPALPAGDSKAALITPKDQSDKILVRGWIKIINEWTLAATEDHAITPAMVTQLEGADDNSDLTKGLVYARIMGKYMYQYKSSTLKVRLDCIDLTEFVVDGVPDDMMDNEYYSKIYPIRLRKRNATDFPPIYIYNCRAIEKEDFFIALLQSCHQLTYERPGSSWPRVMELSASLGYPFASVNSVKMPAENAVWFSAILTRIFAGKSAKAAFQENVQKVVKHKLGRLPNSQYVKSLDIQDVDIVDMPMVTRFSLHPPGVTDDIFFDFHLAFDSDLTLTFEAELEVDSFIKTVNVNVGLKVTLSKLNGKAMGRVKPFPSNRIWIGFYAMPSFELDIVPSVSNTSLRLSLVTDFVKQLLEKKLMEAIVLPNMDDTSFGPGYCDLDDMVDPIKYEHLQDNYPHMMRPHSRSSQNNNDAHVLRRNILTDSVNNLSPTSQDSLLSGPSGLQDAIKPSGSNHRKSKKKHNKV